MLLSVLIYELVLEKGVALGGIPYLRLLN